MDRDLKIATKSGLEYLFFVLVMVLFTATALFCAHEGSFDRFVKTIKGQPIPEETTMKEHTKLLQPYRQRIEGIFADMEVTLNMIDDNADTPDAAAGNGYTVSENLAIQLSEYRKAFDSVLNDMAVGVVDYARQARIDAD